MNTNRKGNPNKLIAELASKSGGWVLIPKLIFTDTFRRSSDKLVISVLLSYDFNGDGCFPPQDTIAQAIRVSKRTVIRSIERLEAMGLPVDRKGGRVNRYYPQKFIEQLLKEQNPQTEPVSNCHPTSVSLSPHKYLFVTPPVTNSTSNNKKNRTKNNKNNRGDLNERPKRRIRKGRGSPGKDNKPDKWTALIVHCAGR